MVPIFIRPCAEKSSWGFVLAKVTKTASRPKAIFAPQLLRKTADSSNPHSAQATPSFALPLLLRAGSLPLRGNWNARPNRPANLK
jgi:hypothetical protein